MLDPAALVGGPTAEEADTRAAARRDASLIVPLTLLAILAILIALLRALVAPLYLVATVVLSFAATLGLALLAFQFVFDAPGSDPGLPTLVFLFTVALGVDYNIFLMARVREEARRVGSRPGVVAGLEQTGAVITSAGLILAGTFLVSGLSSLALPGLSSYVSEFLVLTGTFQRYKFAAVVATLGIVLAALYILLMYQRMMTGPKPESAAGTRDLSHREKWVVAPLVALLLVLGFYPKPVLDVINPAVKQRMSDVHEKDPQPHVEAGK